MTAHTCVLAHRRDPDRRRGTRPPYLVCLGCETWLRGALIGADRKDATGRIRERTRGLPELYAELETELPAASGGQAAGAIGGAPTSPLPFRPLVSTHRSAIAATLQTWTVRIAAVRGQLAPRWTDVPRYTGPWLEMQLDWLITVPAIAGFAAEISALRGRAISLLDPVRRSRVHVAWCADTGTDCPGVLVAAMATNDTTLPGVIACDTCSAEWTPVKWAQLGRLVDRARTADTQTAAANMSVAG